MRIRVSYVLLQVCLSGALAAQQAPTPSPPKIEIKPSAVTVSGVTPKAKVAWMEIAREFSEMSLRLVRASDIAVDDDGDGAVEVDLGKPVPPQSVWVAIDLTTGALATGAPAGFPLQTAELPLSALRPGAAGGADLVDLARRQLELLVVRPEKGAWVGTFGDGGVGDVDGEGNGQLQVSLDSLTPLGDTKEPHAPVLLPKDVIVAVDSTSLDLYAVRLTVPR